jgi:hypothetical protein
VMPSEPDGAPSRGIGFRSSFARQKFRGISESTGKTNLRRHQWDRRSHTVVGTSHDACEVQLVLLGMGDKSAYMITDK